MEKELLREPNVNNFIIDIAVDIGFCIKNCCIE